MNDQKEQTRARVAALRARRKAQGLTARGTEPAPPRWKTPPKELAATMGISERTVYRFARESALKKAEKAGLDMALVTEFLRLRLWNARKLDGLATQVLYRPEGPQRDALRDLIHTNMVSLLKT